MKARALAPNSLTALPAVGLRVRDSDTCTTPQSARPLVSSRDGLETLFIEHADFIFRTCRHLGLDPAAAEDATQQVFMIAGRKLKEIPDGKERAFLFATARNIVANTRRTLRRRREDFTDVDVVDEARGPEQLFEQARARELVDHVLEHMDLDLRAAFVLFEVEQLSFTEISELVGIPRGTVASRVRRAREDFESRVKRMLGSHATGGSQ